jgi:uncharacterized protein YndB with AHSA1/START domain
MNQHATIDGYGVLIEPTTLKLERLLPGPIERVWDYLTDSDLRRQWLASGDMELTAGAPFELTWHNDELTDPPGEKPEGFGSEHSMASRIVEVDPPRKLVFAWGNSGDVSFELEEQGDKVQLTLIHRKLPSREMLIKVAAGWHAHVGVMVAKVSGEAPPPFWDTWQGLCRDYDQRIPA